MRVELEKIIDNLETVFRGDAWHGPSILELLQSMPNDITSRKFPYSKHSIAELVFHLTAWRKFVIKKIEGDIHYDLVNEEDNYGTEDVLQDWKILIENLKLAQSELVEKLESCDDELLAKMVPGQYYDFHKLLTGLIQHDTYHLGMIWVLWE
ncbi:MAG: DinB family protein [Spirosomataceae bacterium]